MADMQSSGNPLEKIALSILAAVILMVLGWVGLTVNQNQIQYARIEERLANQGTTLAQIRKSIDISSSRSAAFDERMMELEHRISVLEQERRKNAD